MATYAIGDIQGCFDELQLLLEKIDFHPEKDQLWLVGDLVNRGPKSLETLRYLYSIRKHIQIVLGNHDLHLLATAAGAIPPRNKDTFAAILEAPDSEQLLNWLQSQPLFYHDQSLGYAMVHAGIPPQWSLKQAKSLAEEVETVLRGNNSLVFFEAMYGDIPNKWSEELEGPARWRLITNYLTRMRFCTSEGELELKNKGKSNENTSSLPKEKFVPWFTLSKRKNRSKKIIFGHWAALMGKTNTKNIYALDTGCVWGYKLSAMRLEDETLFSVDSLCLPSQEREEL